MRQAVRPSGVALALVVLFSGCGDGTPSATSSTKPATVKGTVTRKGKPLPKVQVMFVGLMPSLGFGSCTLPSNVTG